MRTVPIESTGRTLQSLLPKIARNDAVFMTVEGQVRFVVLAADEGDQEVLAMRGNRRLMEFLDRCGERAQTGPRKSLQPFVRKRKPGSPDSRPAPSEPTARTGGLRNARS